MKLITTIVRPERLPEVKAALFRAGVTGITLSRVSGHGATRGAAKRTARRRHVRRGGEMRAPLLLLDAAAISSGDTAWVLASTALVMLMTVGLAFFYGGLVRPKNSLNTMMMSVVALGVIGVQWVLVGYSVAFGHGSPFWGRLACLGFKGVGVEPDAAYAATIPLQADALL